MLEKASSFAGEVKFRVSGLNVVEQLVPDVSAIDGVNQFQIG